MRGIATVTLMLAASAAARPPGSDLDPRDFDAGLPVTIYSLEVLPLYTREGPPYDDYQVLEPALEAKTVAIRETSPDGEVPWLRVRNQGELPLFLLGGEVVLGGRQDRMIQTDTIVDAGKSERVPVRCVEAGRWSGADLSFQSAGAVAHGDLRRAALFFDQGEVWNEVARKSQASGVSSPTGTYRRVVQDEKVRRRLRQYIDELQGKIPRSERLAGLGMAINGEIEVVDLFDSPRLYGKIERKLLASYLLTALERQPARKIAGRPSTGKITKQGIDDLSVNSLSADGSLGLGGLGGLGTTAPSQKTFRHKSKAVHGTLFGKGTGGRR